MLENSRILEKKTVSMFQVPSAIEQKRSSHTVCACVKWICRAGALERGHREMKLK
jgi:hypothetical protein